jgi:hypothetical protein
MSDSDSESDDEICDFAADDTSVDCDGHPFQKCAECGARGCEAHREFVTCRTCEATYCGKDHMTVVECPRCRQPCCEIGARNWDPCRFIREGETLEEPVCPDCASELRSFRIMKKGKVQPVAPPANPQPNNNNLLPIPTTYPDDLEEGEATMLGLHKDASGHFVDPPDVIRSSVRKRKRFGGRPSDGGTLTFETEPSGGNGIVPERTLAADNNAVQDMEHAKGGSAEATDKVTPDTSPKKMEMADGEPAEATDKANYNTSPKKMEMTDGEPAEATDKADYNTSSEKMEDGTEDSQSTLSQDAPEVEAVQKFKAAFNSQ